MIFKTNKFILLSLSFYSLFFLTYEGFVHSQTLKSSEIFSEGIGNTPDSAKKNAFKNAVSRVVGSFVENETLVKNDKVINESIYEYSGGFIEKFDVISQGKDNEGLFRIKIKVTVIEKNLVEKLRSMKIDVKEVIGSNLKAQVESQNQIRDDGKKIIYSIMEEYPRLWSAKQVSDPRIENGSIAVSIDVSVDRKEYLAWAEKLCSILDKSADKKSTLFFVKEGPANYNKPIGRVLKKEPDYFQILVNEPFYFKPTPQSLNVQRVNGKIFSIVKDFSSNGNCEMVCYQINNSNPLFSIFNVNSKSDDSHIGFRFGDIFLPNQLDINVWDRDNKQIFAQKYRSEYFNKLWNGTSFHFGMNPGRGRDYLNPITPFPFIYLQRGFENGNSSTVYSLRCSIKVLVPVSEGDVEKVSKITSGFSVAK